MINFNLLIYSLILVEWTIMLSHILFYVLCYSGIVGRDSWL